VKKGTARRGTNGPTREPSKAMTLSSLNAAEEETSPNELLINHLAIREIGFCYSSVRKCPFMRS
jgi:hypothetical protein